MPNKIEKLDFSTVLASSVHDMKNSLAMLLGSLSDITSECRERSCSIHKELSRIQHEGQRVNRDLIQLLTLYKIDKSQHCINIEEVYLCEFLEEIVLEHEGLLNEHGVEISFQCEPSLTGFFDKEMVAGVFKTVISNAYQYANDKILVTAKNSDGYLELTVEDNGPGYPEHMLYDNLDQKSGSNFGTGSTGLGLYFSSQVAELHKNKNNAGFIKITNNSDINGGCFSIFLP